MVFSSLTFLYAYLPIVLAVYFLVPLRFPKLKRKVKYIDVYSYGHDDDLKPTNRSKIDNSCLGKNLSVKALKKKHKGGKIYE